MTRFGPRLRKPLAAVAEKTQRPATFEPLLRHCKVAGCPFSRTLCTAATLKVPEKAAAPSGVWGIPSISVGFAVVTPSRVKAFTLGICANTLLRRLDTKFFIAPAGTDAGSTKERRISSITGSSRARVKTVSHISTFFR